LVVVVVVYDEIEKMVEIFVDLLNEQNVVEYVNVMDVDIH
jgi:hypothetical protein